MAASGPLLTLAGYYLVYRPILALSKRMKGGVKGEEKEVAEMARAKVHAGENRKAPRSHLLDILQLIYIMLLIKCGTDGALPGVQSLFSSEGWPRSVPART